LNIKITKQTQIIRVNIAFPEKNKPKIRAGRATESGLIRVNQTKSNQKKENEDENEDEEDTLNPTKSKSRMAAGLCG
jgi:hypothetical protein